MDPRGRPQTTRHTVQLRSWAALLAVFCLLGQSVHASFHLASETHSASAEPESQAHSAIELQSHSSTQPADGHHTDPPHPPHSDADHQLHAASQRSEFSVLLGPMAVLAALLLAPQPQPSPAVFFESSPQVGSQRCASPCQPRSPPAA